MKMPDGWNNLRYESDVRFALDVLCFDMTRHDVIGYAVYAVIGRAPHWMDAPTFTGNLDEVRCFLQGAFVMSRTTKR